MDENKPCQLLGRALFARLEPGHADAELRRELAKRLHRGRACPGFDPADIGVGDARLGEVSLRETEALSSLPQSSSDCSRRAIGRSCHSAGSLASTSRDQRDLACASSATMRGVPGLPYFLRVLY